MLQAVYILLNTGILDFAVVTVPKGGAEKAGELLHEDRRISELLSSNLFFAEGVETRQEPVFNGLKVKKTSRIARTKY